MTRARRRRGRDTSGVEHAYPRTARVNELLREIIASELERLGDERLEEVAITGVRVDPELSSAIVYFDTLVGGDADDETLEGLAALRVRLQHAIARQARLRRTPELRFRPD